MASSSVSQESLDRDDYYEHNTRRSRLRFLRGRAMPENGEEGDREVGEDSPTRARFKDNKRPGRPNHLHTKGKTAKDKRKLREKRRSTGVVHLASTESTGDSLDDDESETKKNTALNEDQECAAAYEERLPKSFVSRRNKSPSDLEADLEDNQDYDSTVSQSETNLTTVGQPVPGQPAPKTYTRVYGDNHHYFNMTEQKFSYRYTQDPKANEAKTVQPPVYPSVSTTCKDEESGDSKSNSSNSEGSKNGTLTRNEDLERSLQREKANNEQLRKELSEKDNRIRELEIQLGRLLKEFEESKEEKETLAKDNDSLIRILTKLST